jgi:hypothetical protein
MLQIVEMSLARQPDQAASHNASSYDVCGVLGDRIERVYRRHVTGPAAIA